MEVLYESWTGEGGGGGRRGIPVWGVSSPDLGVWRIDQTRREQGTVRDEPYRGSTWTVSRVTRFWEVAEE